MEADGTIVLNADPPTPEYSDSEEEKDEGAQKKGEEGAEVMGAEVKGAEEKGTEVKGAEEMKEAEVDNQPALCSS